MLGGFVSCNDTGHPFAPQISSNPKAPRLVLAYQGEVGAAFFNGMPEKSEKNEKLDTKTRLLLINIGGAFKRPRLFYCINIIISVNQGMKPWWETEWYKIWLELAKKSYHNQRKCPLFFYERD